MMKIINLKMVINVNYENKPFSKNKKFQVMKQT